MIENIHAARDAALHDIAQASSPDDVVAMTTRYAGKKGELAGLKKQLGSLESIDDKKVAGAAINEAIAAVDAALTERRSALEAEATAARVEAERLDLTEYVGKPARGHAHLVTQAWERLEDVFVGMGFRVAEGPEVETDWHNFEALNMGEGHPARGEFDTLFVDHGAPGSTLLRTHTSPVQIRSLKDQGAPIRIIAPGRVYRSDSDATHTPMFHQVEGLAIDRNISMANLKWVLEEFCGAFFEVEHAELRFRASHFPFTEPSAEVDIRCSWKDGQLKVGEGDDWLEILGSGMVHPKVLAAGGIDPEIWQGFAFGIGIDRIAMLKYGIPDLRSFFDSDLRWLRHYGFSVLDKPTIAAGLSA